jgi:hypothetical protein
MLKRALKSILHAAATSLLETLEKRKEAPKLQSRELVISSTDLCLALKKEKEVKRNEQVWDRKGRE